MARFEDTEELKYTHIVEGDEIASLVKFIENHDAKAYAFEQEEILILDWDGIHVDYRNDWWLKRDDKTSKVDEAGVIVRVSKDDLLFLFLEIFDLILVD